MGSKTEKFIEHETDTGKMVMFIVLRLNLNEMHFTIVQNIEFIGSSDAANGYIAGAMLMIKLWVPTGVGQ